MCHLHVLTKMFGGDLEVDWVHVGYFYLYQMAQELLLYDYITLHVVYLVPTLYLIEKVITFHCYK